MKELRRKLLISGICILFLASLSFSQVELTLFGKYNVNLSFPDTGTIHPDVAAVSWTEWWEPVFGPILEQKNGFGFGARISFNPVPTIGIEGSFEYILGGFELSADVMADLEEGTEGAGYGPYLTTNNSGGNILRYYGNIVFNIPTPGGVYPYITAGLGITQFNVKKGTGPDIYYDVPSWGALADVQYDNISALTFNAGGGIKFLFSKTAGLRADVRVFYCKPEFEESLHFKIFGVTAFNDVAFTQTGGLTDTSINLGVFFKF